MIDWQMIVKKHGPAVWQTAYRLLGNHTDTADCFQETFISALEVAQRQCARNFPALLVWLATARAIVCQKEAGFVPSAMLRMNWLGLLHAAKNSFAVSKLWRNAIFAVIPSLFFHSPLRWNLVPPPGPVYSISNRDTSWPILSRSYIHFWHYAKF